ncbi:MAG TPA: serine hydrolase domain-containing protein [Candidatus Cybelea sp.]|nr:serine hydrolase domain-containing protein [Candidatus Cybelea sp.]
MKRWGPVFATAFALCIAAQAAPEEARAQNSVTLTPAISDRIDDLAREQIHGGRTPGLAIGVVQDGRIVYARGFGFGTVGKHVPMAPDTQFYVGGLTREFTAAAILLLSQDNKVALGDKLAKYVPEFKLGAAITVGELLTETSGLPPYTPQDPTKPIKVADVIAEIDAGKPLPVPGSYVDTPLNYLLAALVVERASGLPLSDYLEQHIFIPLVMDNTFLAGDSGIAAAHATGYTRSGRSFVAAPVWDPSWLGGNAGLVTTLYDLAKWDIEMPILLRVDAVRTMFTPAGSSGPTRYGMGWVIDRRGGKDFVWSNGEISGYRAMSAVLPEQHVGVIVFSNADSFHGAVAIPEELGARILDLIVPPATAHLENSIVDRAKEWLDRLATGRIERDELTPSFSAYLTDDLIAKDDLASLGPVISIVPESSTTEAGGNTLYEFIVSYRRAQYHYEFELTPQGKIDGLSLTA